jgi:hypothetical protein
MTLFDVIHQFVKVFIAVMNNFFKGFFTDLSESHGNVDIYFMYRLRFVLLDRMTDVFLFGARKRVCYGEHLVQDDPGREHVCGRAYWFLHTLNCSGAM